MKKPIDILMFSGMIIIVSFLSLAAIPWAYSASITETEAISVSNQWMTRELTSNRVKLNVIEKNTRLSKLSEGTVYYLSGPDELTDIRPDDAAQILAYIITYPEGGYTVLYADDRIDPVLAFDAKARFQWSGQEGGPARALLGRIVEDRRAYLKAAKDEKRELAVHPNWETIRSGTLEKDTTVADAAPKATQIMLDTAAWNQRSHYNDTVVENNGGWEIPTGCTATAMAILMRYYMWPPTGTGSLNWTHTVVAGDPPGFYIYEYDIDLDGHTYNWLNMPTTDLTSPNKDVADLMYHCGVSVHMDYQTSESTAWLWANAMRVHFLYYIEEVPSGGDTFPFDHDTPMIESLLAGVPVIFSTSSHTMVACGYRDIISPYFYVNAGWGGGSDGWYNLNDLQFLTDPTVNRSYPYCTPNHYTYVDGSSTETPTGWLSAPYQTIEEGYDTAHLDGVLKIKGGIYTVSDDSSFILNTKITLQGYQGSVLIQ